jgi:hypothetical protein
MAAEGSSSGFSSEEDFEDHWQALMADRVSDLGLRGGQWWIGDR